MTAPCLSFVRTRFLSLLALVLGPALIAGCGCTDAGCVAAVAVEYTVPLPAGEYELAYESSVGDGTCPLTVFEDGDAEIIEGCPAYFGPNLIEWHEEVDWISISVERLETSEVVNQRFEPEYSTSRPNGNLCGPQCRSAEVELDTSLFIPEGQNEESSTPGQGGAGGSSSMD